jgi:hypothetical protein
MPSFSSYSSFSSAPTVGQGTSGSGSALHSDWSSAPSHVSTAGVSSFGGVVDDSDADLPLFAPSASSHHTAAGLHALSGGVDDDVLIPAGSSLGGSALGSSWLNKQAGGPGAPFAATTLQSIGRNAWDQ